MLPRSILRSSLQPFKSSEYDNLVSSRNFESFLDVFTKDRIFAWRSTGLVWHSWTRFPAIKSLIPDLFLKWLTKSCVWLQRAGNHADEIFNQLKKDLKPSLNLPPLGTLTYLLGGRPYKRDKILFITKTLATLAEKNDLFYKSEKNDCTWNLCYTQKIFYQVSRLAIELVRKSWSDHGSIRFLTTVFKVMVQESLLKLLYLICWL